MLVQIQIIYSDGICRWWYRPAYDDCFHQSSGSRAIFNCNSLVQTEMLKGAHPSSLPRRNPGASDVNSHAQHSHSRGKKRTRSNGCAMTVGCHLHPLVIVACESHKQWHLTTPFPWHSRACLSLSFSTCNPTFKCGDLLMQNHSRLSLQSIHHRKCFKTKIGAKLIGFPTTERQRYDREGQGLHDKPNCHNGKLQTIAAQLWRS